MSADTVETFQFHGAISDDGEVYIRAIDMTGMFRATIAHFTALFVALEDVEGEDRDTGISLVAAIQVLQQESDAVDVAAMDFLTTESDVSPEG